MAKRDITIRVGRIEDQDDHDEEDMMSPLERLALMEVLRNSFSLDDRAHDAPPRLQRHVVRVIRREG